MFSMYRIGLNICIYSMDKAQWKWVPYNAKADGYAKFLGGKI